jgi:hypothetical protein
MSKDSLSSNCVLPAFAAPYPTLTVGNQPKKAQGLVMIPEACDLLKVLKKVKTVKASKGIHWRFLYGRRGTYKVQQSLAYQGCTSRREKAAYLYEVPPMPQCNETMDKHVMAFYIRVLVTIDFSIRCVHSELLPA